MTIVRNSEFDAGFLELRDNGSGVFRGHAGIERLEITLVLPSGQAEDCRRDQRSRLADRDPVPKRQIGPDCFPLVEH